MKSRPALKAQKKKKFINRGIKKAVYRTLIVLSLFISALLFLGGYLTYQRLTGSFASAMDSGNGGYSTISDQFPTLVYVVVKDLKSDPQIILDIKYLVFDRSGKKILVYTIPVEYKFDLAGKYGEEEISKALALSALNSNNPIEDGINGLKNSVLKIFGFKVDKFILANASSRNLFDDLLGNGSFLDYFKLKQFMEIQDEFKTDLTLEEFYNLFSFIKSIPNDRLINKILALGDLTDSKIIDASFEDISLDSYVSQESKNVSVLNGTDISGIASLGARIVKNMGGRVVALGNADKTYSQSVIIADDPNSQTCRFISRVFNIRNIVSKTTGSIQEHEVDRSDIVVIMGFDTTEKLY